MDPFNRTDTLSWQGDVTSTLNQELISQSLGAAMSLVRSVLQTFNGVYEARTDFWEDLSRNDSTQVARTVIEYQQDLGAAVTLQYLTVTKMLLVLRGAKGEYALTEKGVFDIHDRLAEGWNKVETEGDLDLRIIDQWVLICSGVVNCFKEAQLNPRLVTNKDFDRITKAIRHGLKATGPPGTMKSFRKWSITRPRLTCRSVQTSRPTDCSVISRPIDIMYEAVVPTLTRF